MSRETDIAWAAGVIEGEGSFNLHNNHAAVSVEMTDEDVVLRLKDIFGGNICKPTKRKDHWKQSWRWQLQAKKESVQCLELILPYLSNRRTEKAISLINHSNEFASKQELKKAATISTRDSIKKKKNSGLTHKQIADMFSVDRTYVTHVLNGKYD